MMHVFDKDTEVVEKTPLQSAAVITDNWLINRIANGGYLMALMARAMQHHSDKAQTPILTANYIERCKPGPIAIRLERYARSRQFDRFEARLHQEGRERVRAIGTFADLKNACFLERVEALEPDIAPLEDCLPVAPWPGYSLFEHVDLRLDQQVAGWWEGRLEANSVQQGWIRFKEQRHHDICSIVLMMDAFPPAIFTTEGVRAWVPTIELSVNIRTIPTTSWLKCRFRTCFITCGMVEEDGEMWDASGNIVAISRQIAQFRPPEG
jgi:hypothetical protein